MTAAPLAAALFFLAGLLLLVYALTDGFDLGVGILTLFCRDEERCGVLADSIAGVWHANQTWLVIVGGVLFGAFPLAFGVVFSGLYVPCMLLLFALIARATSLELREGAGRKSPWNRVFGWGSLGAAVAQGLALGGYLKGFRVDADHFAGGAWDWLNPLCGVGAVGLAFGYSLLGATYLLAKTDGALREWCRRAAARAAVGALASAVVGCAWIFAAVPPMAAAWAARLPLFGLIGSLALVSWALLLRTLSRGDNRRPLLWSLAFVTCGFAALVVGLYPVAIPPDFTVADAAAPRNTLVYMLWALGLLTPVMIAYNAYMYLVFRGRSSEGYGGYG